VFNDVSEKRGALFPQGDWGRFRRLKKWWKKKYVDIDVRKFVVSQPAVDSLLSATLPGHKCHTFLDKRSFRSPIHFSSHLNMILSHSRRQSSPAKFGNRHPAPITHLNIQLECEGRDKNRVYISALCNRESFSTKAEDNCNVFLFLMLIYLFDFTRIQYQHLLWCLKHRWCVWSPQKDRLKFIF